MTPPRPRLSPGDLVVVVSPAAPLAGQFSFRTARGISTLEGLGLRVRTASHALGVAGHVSASAEDRAADINAALRDPEVRGIIATAGGWNCNALLDLLDVDALVADPKVICGYSDVTALLLGLWHHAGVVTFSGPALLPQFAESPAPHPFTIEAWKVAVGLSPWRRELAAASAWTAEPQPWDAVDPAPRAYRPAQGPQVLRPGNGSGPIVAGHLSTLCALLATKHLPDLTGTVLWLEQEAGGALGELERDLVHLRQAGALQSTAGIVFGRFAGKPASHVAPVIGSVLEAAPGPIVLDADFGHTDPMLTLPIGMTMSLEAPEGRTPRLALVD